MGFTSLIFHKPYDCLSQWTREVPSHTTIADYITDVPSDVYPVGRLDRDSEGLLLLTNDTRANKRLLSPTRHVDKEYWVQVEGIPSDEAINQLQGGVSIKAKGKIHNTMPCQVIRLDDPQVADRDPPIRQRKHIPTTWLSITLREGKNRQVRKMLASVGHPVLRLIRVRIGSYHLGDLAAGEWQIVAFIDK